MSAQLVIKHAHNFLSHTKMRLKKWIYLFLVLRNSPSGPGPPLYRGFTFTFRHTTLGRTPLDEWSAGRRNLYLTTHNTHKTQEIYAPTGFEPTIPASSRPQTHALDRAATGIGKEGSSARIKFESFLLQNFSELDWNSVAQWNINGPVVTEMYNVP
jgi:hypothetical protein